MSALLAFLFLLAAFLPGVSKGKRVVGLDLKSAFPTVIGGTVFVLYGLERSIGLHDRHRLGPHPGVPFNGSLPCLPTIILGGISVIAGSLVFFMPGWLMPFLFWRESLSAKRSQTP